MPQFMIARSLIAKGSFMRPQNECLIMKKTAIKGMKNIHIELKRRYNVDSFMINDSAYGRITSHQQP